MLTEEEKARVRFHLGYPGVTALGSFQLGIPRPIQTQFLLESAMNVLMPFAEQQVRQILGVMDGIQQKLVGVQDTLVAEKLEELSLRENVGPLLEEEYRRWGEMLADQLGVAPYPLSTKYKRRAFGGMGNAKVVRN